MKNKIKKILVANRGDSAIRIIRACKEMNIETIGIYSLADANALHTKLADRTICIGNCNMKDSYLNIYRILAAAEISKVDAIHPGIGCLSENPKFAKVCEKAGFKFIGPNSKTIELMGNKVNAKEVAQKCGVPVLKQNSIVITSDTNIDSLDLDVDFPVVLKAVYGGGGKGIKVIESNKDLLSTIRLCLKEAESAFGDSKLLIEQYVSNARHVEVQILADYYGNIIHLGDRECSIQRNKQKFIEETRSTNISDSLREQLYKDAIKICREIGYVGPGTIEFLVTKEEKYFFLEMNTRLQVEHTISEMITGVDIVKAQIEIFSGEKLSLQQSYVNFNGYAIQCRIMSESYNNYFVPSCGTIKRFTIPGGFGVRVDTGYEIGNSISPFYDSLLCKISCHGKTKEEAVAIMKRCIAELEIQGVNTNKVFLNRILNSADFINGNYCTTYFEDKIKAICL